MGITVEIPLARKLLPLLEPKRYKGLYGGRGGGKSWTFADLVVERCLMYPGTNVVCIREVQATLDQSVKKLIENRIRHYGVESHFKIQDAKIHTPGGGIIIFMGMQNHTAESIKSLESYDVAWVEEAQTLSAFSLELLRPTIRKDATATMPASELWFSWNPRDPKDPVDVFLRKNPPEESTVLQINYYENPYFPKVLEQEVDIDRRRDPDKFRHVWLGEYWNQGAARVFKNWIVKEFESPEWETYRLGADWGFANDPAVLVRMFLKGRQLFIDHEAYMVGVEIDFLPDLFDIVPGSRRFFITADSSRPETISYLQRNGFPRIKRSIKGKKSVMEGIEFLKNYDIVIHPRCVHVADEFSKYSWKVDPLTQEVLPILEDKENHCIAEGELVLCERGPVPIEQVTTEDRVLTRGGFNRVLFSDITDVNRRTVTVKTTCGSVRCTPDHEIWTERGFVRADMLKAGDIVTTTEEWEWLSAFLGTGTSTADTRKATACQTRGTFSGRSAVGLLGFTETFGNFTTGKYRQGTTSTTSTGTQPTTTYRTSPACLARNISRSILGMKIGGCAKRNILKTFGHLQRGGIVPLKALRNIVKSAGCLTRTVCLSIRSAIVAGTPSSPLLQAAGFAPTLARRNGDVTPGKTTSKRFVRLAAKSSKQAGTAGPSVVRGRVLTVTEAPIAERVYDLTVEHNHEFFVNGVLVSNCIDACRYGLEGVRRAEKYKSLDIMPSVSYPPLDAVVGI